MPKVLRVILLNILASLVLLESVFQVADYVGAHKKRYPLINQNPAIASIYHLIQPPFTWEEYFLNLYSGGELVYKGLYQPDALLGWSMKTSLSVNKDGLTFTSNQQGFRSLHNFANDPDKYQIMIVGDSFTFGDEISDEITWPHLLEAKNKKLNVLNMGGSGYGPDQMLLVLQQQAPRYKPDLIIVAFISDDLNRSMIGFRDFKKPKFELQKNALTLKNVPIGSVDEVAAEVRSAAYKPSRIHLVNLWHELLVRSVEENCKHLGSRCQQLNTAIFERMQTVASEAHADLLIVYLPVVSEMDKASSNNKLYGEIFFEDFQKTHSNYFLNPRPQFIAAPLDRVRHHHYQLAENQLLSRLVYEKVSTLPSWQHKVAAH